MSGILYLTKVPKLPLDIPTDIAKTKLNIKQSTKTGDLLTAVNVFIIPTRQKILIVNNKKYVASSADNAIVGLRDSHIKGRNNATTNAWGASLAIPPSVPSCAPIL